MFARLSATTDFSGLRNADAVLEAVTEDLTLKQEILREVEALVDPRCLYASNASSIPIARIAQAAVHPERVLGMRYFNPVAKTQLLEVVRADKTAPWAVATAVAIGKRQGKTVIVVKDGPGVLHDPNPGAAAQRGHPAAWATACPRARSIRRSPSGDSRWAPSSGSRTPGSTSWRRSPRGSTRRSARG